ncbi:fungal-specific transcription factor domain-containing protein [Nemania sp. FL0031]|nr:fungal-specific transcription factor domain-containing protein [Nemania sp. FL0031]
MKSIACRKCHAKKIKCSGGRPCQSCLHIGCQEDCIYPKRDRQVKVNQSYVDNILRENEELRMALSRQKTGSITRASSSPSANTAASSVAPDAETQLVGPTESPNRNPALRSRPWFQSIKSSNVPILIGEIADAAFATRCRQVLSIPKPDHQPRVSYPHDDQITALAQSDIITPNPTHARFLLRSALAYIDGRFHLVRRSEVFDLCEQFLLNQDSLSTVLRCEVLALFALGELFSNRCSNPAIQIPGLAYFSHASKAYSILQERPSVECIEAAMMLCLFSLCVNRRHSAYFLASSAVRLGVVMGLHFNIPESQLQDASLRQHLNWIWWTSYVLDHTCAAISSQIPSISDEDIFVDMPLTMPDAEKSDVDKFEYISARTQLARLSKRIISSLYGRAQQPGPFLQRVQHALRDLRQWLQALPVTLQMKPEPTQSTPENVRFLHLAFNQIVIVTTRPILLHVLHVQRQSSRSTSEDSRSHISDSVRSLAHACIRCARNSYTILIDLWMEDFFKTFDYFNTQFLFSAATILAISSLLAGIGDTGDVESLELASQLLIKLRDAGSFVAVELCQHILALKEVVQNSILDPSLTYLMGTEATEALSAMEPSETLGPSVLSVPSIEAFLLQDELEFGDFDIMFDIMQQEEHY